MLCQRCKKNQATLYYKQNINGKVTQISLCSDCAKELGGVGSLGLGGIFGSPDDTLGAVNLLSNLFDGRHSRPTPTLQRLCPLCGSSMRDIASSGKVQCAKCYEVFAEELTPMIANIHGSVLHKGRSPKKYQKASDDQKVNNENSGKTEDKVNNNMSAEDAGKLETLRRELEAAIKAEAYEDAVKLRDEIRRLEKEER